MIHSSRSGKKVFQFSLMAMFLALLFFSCKDKTYNLVCISLDTTRYDFINTGRGARANTPELRRFASQALVMENAFATIPQTLPSHLSIFTGRLPHECSVLSNENEYNGKHKMLQDILREKGYFTAGIISLGTLNEKSGFNQGFDLFKDDLFSPGVFYIDGEKISRSAESILDIISQKPFYLFAHYSDPHSPYAPPGMHSDFTILLNQKPVATFNAYIGSLLKMEIPLEPGSHTLTFSNKKTWEDFQFFIIRRLKFSPNCRVRFDKLEYSKQHYNGSHLLRGPEGLVHIDCRGKGFLKIFQVIPILGKQAAVTGYTREVEYMDKQVGKLLKKLRQEKFRDNTIVAIFADHGEGLGERDAYFGHVRYLNQQFIRVPLMIYLPGVSPRHIHTPVSMLGITPTLLDFMKIQVADFPMAENWMPLVKRKKIKWNRPILSFAFQPSAVSDKLSVVKWPFQTIFNLATDQSPAREFYNLNISQSFSRFDQISKKVMIASSGKHYRSLVNVTQNHKSIFYKKYPLILVDAKDIEKLKTLGYIN